MDAVMGGNPLESLKAMINPVNIVKSQLNKLVGGALQRTGPVGSLIGNQLLEEFSNKLIPSKSNVVSQPPSPQLLNNLPLAQRLLVQTNDLVQLDARLPKQLITTASAEALLKKTDLSSAVADNIVPVILGEGYKLKYPLTPYGKQAVQQGREVMKQSTSALLTLADSGKLTSKVDYRELFTGMSEQKGKA
ncbi:MAG: hypothetical protein CSB47_11615 [Proteobacteria bacterium]|nr:MAG: hypothetical protein CSB47_11615 [Pseudomonadota bacterium]